MNYSVAELRGTLLIKQLLLDKFGKAKWKTEKY